MSEANLIPLPLAIFGAAMNVVVVIVGIGFLIFVHELGHFLVAKWNKVRVEAFSLGFGPVIWGFWKGETHYRLSLVPLGGYVKMAGGDAPTASYESDDPGEFPNKSVPVRIAVYSAGVVMNLITGILFFVAAFNIGVPLMAPVAGVVQPDQAAWKAGIRPGDRVLTVGGREILDFEDILYAVAFADSAVDIEVERDGERLTFERVEPAENKGLGIRMIGLGMPPEHTIEVRPGSPAERAGLVEGDKLLNVGRVDVRNPVSHVVLVRELRAARGPLTVVVRRGGESGETLTFELTPDLVPASDKPHLGVSPVIAKILGVTPGSPAEDAGFESGDVFAKVNGVPTHSYYQALELACAGTPDPVLFTVRRGEEEVALPQVSGPTSAADWRRFFLDLYEGHEDLKATTISFDRSNRFEDGIPIEKAGLREGSTILTVAGREIESFSDIREAIAEVDEGEPVAVTYRLPGVRDGDREGPRAARVLRGGLSPIDRHGPPHLLHAWRDLHGPGFREEPRRPDRDLPDLLLERPEELHPLPLLPGDPLDQPGDPEHPADPGARRRPPDVRRDRGRQEETALGAVDGAVPVGRPAGDHPADGFRHRERHHTSDRDVRIQGGAGFSEAEAPL
jgi:regulator of sigma E protease